MKSLERRVLLLGIFLCTNYVHVSSNILDSFMEFASDNTSDNTTFTGPDQGDFPPLDGGGFPPLDNETWPDDLPFAVSDTFPTNDPGVLPVDITTPPPTESTTRRKMVDAMIFLPFVPKNKEVDNLLTGTASTLDSANLAIESVNPNAPNHVDIPPPPMPKDTSLFDAATGDKPSGKPIDPNPTGIPVDPKPVKPDIIKPVNPMPTFKPVNDPFHVPHDPKPVDPVPMKPDMQVTDIPIDTPVTSLPFDPMPFEPITFFPTDPQQDLFPPFQPLPPDSSQDLGKHQNPDPLPLPLPDPKPTAQPLPLPDPTTVGTVQAPWKIPDSWTTKFNKPERMPQKTTTASPIPFEPIITAPPAETRLYALNLRTFGRHRGLNRALRLQRKRARMNRRKRKREQQKKKKERKAARRGRGRGRGRNMRMSRNQGPKRPNTIARMVLPGKKRPFIGKKNKGRGRRHRRNKRMARRCRGRRRRLNLCSPDGPIAPNNVGPGNGPRGGRRKRKQRNKGRRGNVPQPLGGGLPLLHAHPAVGDSGHQHVADGPIPSGPVGPGSGPRGRKWKRKQKNKGRKGKRFRNVPLHLEGGEPPLQTQFAVGENGHPPLPGPIPHTHTTPPIAVPSIGYTASTVIDTMGTPQRGNKRQRKRKGRRKETGKNKQNRRLNRQMQRQKNKELRKQKRQQRKREPKILAPKKMENIQLPQSVGLKTNEPYKPKIDHSEPNNTHDGTKVVENVGGLTIHWDKMEWGNKADNFTVP